MLRSAEFSMNKFYNLMARGEFNKASACERSLFWYLSLFVMCKAWDQYNERSRALALLNSPQELVLPQYSSSLSSVQSSFPSQSTSLGTQSPLSHSYCTPLHPVYAERGDMQEYLHFQSKPLINHYIFATTHSLMTDTKFD